MISWTRDASTQRDREQRGARRNIKLDSSHRTAFDVAVIFDTGTRALPREIEVEKSPGRTRYRLPRRRLGWLHLLGLLPLGFGLAFAAIPATMLWNFAGSLAKSSPWAWLILVVPMLFLLAGLKPITFGLLLLCGRSTVEITRDTLRAVDSAGPFRSARKSKLSDIRGFEVSVPGNRETPSFLEFLNRIGGLEAKFDAAKPMPVAIGYPREFLMALGDELTSLINERQAVQAAPTLPKTVESTKQFSSDVKPPIDAADVFTQPAGSHVRVEETRDSLTFTVPPAGVWRGSKGLFVFALIWCSFIGVFTAVIAFASRKAAGPLLAFGLFLSLFWAIGIGLLLGAINMGRRRAVLVATANDLRVAQQSVFGRKLWMWSRDELASICVGGSGMEVNNRPVLNLQIHTVAGKKHGLFAGRDEAELQWMATMLRTRLGLRAA